MTLYFVPHTQYNKIAVKRFLPVALILILYLYLTLTAFKFSQLAFAYSYGDHVNVNGYKYSGCSGSGGFGSTNGNYYVCDANPCGGGRITVAPSTGGCFSSGVFYADQGDVSPLGGSPTPTLTPTPTPTPTPGLCEQGTTNGEMSVIVTDTRTGTTYPGTLTAHSISSSNCSNCCNKDEGRTVSLTNGWGLMTIYSPKTDALNGAEIHASELPSGYACVQCSGSTVVPSNGISTVNLTIRSTCPYTAVNAYFRKGTDPESDNLTVPLDSLVSSFARDQNGTDIPNGSVRYQLVQLTDNFGTACESGGECNAALYNNGDGLNLTNTFSWNYNSADAAGTYILYAVPIDAAGADLTACTDQSIYGTANLTVVGCPYRETTVMLADRDKDPFTFYEEEADQPTFCSYGKGGVCTPTMKTHYQKNLRFKVMHQDRNGQVIDAASDANILVRRYTSPTTFVQECDATTGGTVNSGTCLSSHGFVDYFLDPGNTSLAALQSGGATKDVYTIQATTLVTKNSQTFEISAPGCFDTDEVRTDACLYDSTQAYLRKANVYPQPPPWSNTVQAQRGDTVTFAGFHNFADPAAAAPAFATDTKDHLAGPYGLETDLTTNPYNYKFTVAGSDPARAEGEYKFTVIGQRIKDGITYPLPNSEFCSAASSFAVGPKVCVAPPPPTDPVNCCAVTARGNNWVVPANFATQLLGFLNPLGAVPFRIKLGIKNMETTTDAAYGADYLYGTDLTGVVASGVYLRSVPPYEYLNQFSVEGSILNKRRETARYSFAFGGDPSKEFNSGPIGDLAPLSFAAERLQKYFAARPLRPGDIPTSLAPTSSSTNLQANADTGGVGASGAVLGASAPACTAVQTSWRSENLCYGEGDGAEISAADFLALLSQGPDKALNFVLEKADWWGKYLLGLDTTDVTGANSANERDTAALSGGLTQTWLRPGEAGPTDTSGDALANLVLGFQYKNPVTNQWTWVPGLNLDLPFARPRMRYLGAVRGALDNVFLAKTQRPGEERPPRDLPPDTLPPEPTVTPPLSPPPGFTGTCSLCNQTFASTHALKDLLDLVGNTMKVPASVLTGMLRFEGGNFATAADPYPYNHIFKYPDDLINQISQNDGRDPNCAISYAGAVGPCQFMDGAWNTYGSTVNGVLGNPSYVPDRCNLRDCLYAAAAKMRHDGTDNPPATLGAACGGYYNSTPVPGDCNWSLANVAAAGYHYYGACTANYASTLVNYYLNKSCAP